MHVCGLGLICFAGKLYLVDLAGSAWLKHACLGILVSVMQVKVGKLYLVDLAGSERLKHACLWFKPYLLCGQAAPGGFKMHVWAFLFFSCRSRWASYTWWTWQAASG